MLRKKNQANIFRGTNFRADPKKSLIPLEIYPRFFFLQLNHIFLLPLSRFWCSGTVRKDSKNGKNRKEIKWLLMALPKIFRVGRAFLFLEIFLNFLF